MARAIADLGKSAWEQQIIHPAYVDLFEQLGALFQQRTQLRTDLAALDTQIQQENATYNQIKAEHAGRVNAV